MGCKWDTQFRFNIQTFNKQDADESRQKHLSIMNNYKIIVALFLFFISFSCDKYDLTRTNSHDPESKNFTPNLPELTTKAVTDITSNSATLGGIVIKDGGAVITNRGVCWSTVSGPTIADSKTLDGSGTGSYISKLIGLKEITQYYVRAYATNKSGTAYGNELSFTTKGTN
jgi:hypothetical protein